MKKITSPALGDPLPPSGSYCAAPNHSQLAARQGTESERSQSILTFQSCSKSKATIISNSNPEGWTEAEERPSLLAVLAQVVYPPFIFVDFKFSDDWGRLDGKSCWRQGLASHVSGLYHRYFFHVYAPTSVFIKECSCLSFCQATGPWGLPQAGISQTKSRQTKAKNAQLPQIEFAPNMADCI